MNVESLKSELQQVLDNDVLLRKEFNTLKRSLSDYRNQLIMRDEDCKRLQVTIDVLNTKLVVMERDNTTYKSELASFKELRGTIREQLESKQLEIDARVEEIQTLRNDLNLLAANYESQIEELRSQSTNELETVKADYSSQINTLKTNAHYVENGIREEYENRLTELSNTWADKEQSMGLLHEETLKSQLEQHEHIVSQLRSEYESKIESLSSEGDNGIEQLRSTYEHSLSELQNSHVQKLESMEAVYQAEISHLKIALEEQRSTLTTNFNQQIESAGREAETVVTNLKEEFENNISAKESAHNTLLNETIAGYELRISSLVNEYEEKLSNTLIHSNSQNSKLNDELSKAQTEQTSNIDRLNLLSAANDELSAKLDEQATQITSDFEKFSTLQTEFNAFKEQSSLSISDQISELNQQIVELNQNHSEYVSELHQRIDNLTSELANMSQLFESNTNLLAEAETAIELKVNELLVANTQIEELNSRLESFNASFEEKNEEVESFKLELENSVKDEIASSKIEFDKLIAENSNLISEIDSAQDKVEAQEFEIGLLKAELEEVRVQSKGKSDFFKETLSNKNFEITNLEANNAALSKELQLVKEEAATLSSRLLENNGSGEQIEEFKQMLAEKAAQIETLNSANLGLQTQVDQLTAEKEQLMSEMQTIRENVSGLQEQIISLNAVLADNENKLNQAKNSVNTEHEAFVEKLFKQIDELNDARMTLLDEKDQMAGQLLKMNEVVGTISQQIETEQIDVTGLNNHRKNVILANNSDASLGKAPMKEQINDLVREIDKCIALLSA